MFAIKNSSHGKFAYPGTIRRKAGQVVSVTCGPFAHDWGTRAVAEKALADLTTLYSGWYIVEYTSKQ